VRVTDRQREVLDFFRRFVAANGHSPDLVEIAHAFGISKATVHMHLRALVRDGLLACPHPGRRRGYELPTVCEHGHLARSCGLCGQGQEIERLRAEVARLRARLTRYE
jgi:DNA-binding IclR family transcriptional regulator